jgi:ABC-2 type transport system permease protein
MRGILSLTAASTRMLLRSRDAVVMAMLLPVAYVGLIQLLRGLNFVVGPATIGLVGFVAVGVAAGMVPFTNQHTTVAAAATYKAGGMLRRIAVTPLRPAVFIAAHAIPRALITVAETTVVLALARALGTPVRLGTELLRALPVVLVMALTALALGFAIAGYARTAQGANQLDTFVGAPLILISGVLYPITAFPLWLQRVAEYASPYAAPLVALRGILTDGQPLSAFPRQLAITAGWLAVAVWAASRTYRFTQE